MGGAGEGKMADYLNDKRLRAECFGTAALVLIGCGAITMGGFGTNPITGILPIALAFGLTVMAMAYCIGPVSGCHINPAVSAAMWAAGRMPLADAIAYIIAQLIGCLIGAAILILVLKGKTAGYDVASAGLGQTGWSEFGMGSAILAEIIATFIFVMVILGATSKKGATPVAGLVIGLTLVILHLPFIRVSGLSVNPARSLGPAVFVGGTALAQLWVFLVMPMVGGLLAGWLVKSSALDI
jgi:aquaporin Z